MAQVANSSAEIECMPDAGILFGVIRGVVGELYPEWKHIIFTPHAHLEHDLGLNNHARRELRTRIEKALNVSLDEACALNAKTPFDLLRSVLEQARLRKPDAQDRQDVTSNGSYGENHFSSFITASGAIYDATKESRNFLKKWLYAIYTWSVFLVLGIAVWLLMIITPFKHWRQHIAQASGRLLFMCTFTQFTVSGRNNLDASRPQVVVANHSSYLDGFIIAAALGVPAHFIVKGELSRILPIRLLLQRFGVEFVDRFNARSGAKAIWRIAKKSKNGQTLVFFPEGTFTGFPGLQPFRMGAFVTAARSGVPVVPVAIRGARKILAGNHWFPRRGRIEVIILPSIMPDGSSWQNAVKLRDGARQGISMNCGEPDLIEYAIHLEPEKLGNSTAKPSPMAV